MNRFFDFARPLERDFGLRIGWNSLKEKYSNSALFRSALPRTSDMISARCSIFQQIGPLLTCLPPDLNGFIALKQKHLETFERFFGRPDKFF